LLASEFPEAGYWTMEFAEGKSNGTEERT
jgi:hypothetical protein